MAWKNRSGAEMNSRSLVSRKLTIFLCISCFCAGMLFTNRFDTEKIAYLKFYRILGVFGIAALIVILALLN